MVIYADLIFVINALSHMLLFYACKTFIRSVTSFLRILCAAVFGGAYAVCEQIYGISTYLRILPLAVMCLMVWGYKNMLKNAFCVLFVVSCVQGIFAGAMSLLNVNAELSRGIISIFSPDIYTVPLIIAAYVIYCAVKGLLVKNNVYREARLSVNGGWIQLILLYDSGNMLRLHGKPVIIIEYDAIKAAVESENYAAFFKAATHIMRYTTIQGTGFIPVIEPDWCEIDGAEYDIAVGVAEKRFKGKYQGIVGELERIQI